ncbi:nucleoside phosphatase family-domain-containing protein [Triangularia verruculosa]|uniref:Nucleoside phosphatase family-domain-containing protein n=1 Tax=Triangularia verruculosa TaxID=2587418 RepID=A0AAN6XR12_9PEZI|nr:nucleoside phosphatase family-domain-containing protein [Triangularia verruculosa]
MGSKKWRWGVILDAGSSGTRLHIYRWKDPEKALKGASEEELASLPKLMTEKKWTKKIRPGVSTFGKKVDQVGPDHLQSLIDHALQYIPYDKIPDTPIFLMATAGMRLLPTVQQTALTREICYYLRSNTQFSLPDCDMHIQVIKGETEGLYGWIASNYLLGGFDNPDQHQHGKGHHTYGFLDMGGASAQIAFAPNATEAEKHADDLKLLRLRTLDGSPVEYKLFTTTWLGFGVNQARQSYVESLADLYPPSSSELPDPCLPRGLRTTLDGVPVTTPKPKNTILIGTGHFDECLKKTYPLLGKDKPCHDNPCLIDGQHVPAIDFDVNHFIGVSEYWHTTHGVFGGKDDKAYDFATYQKRVKDYCSQDWSSISANFNPKKEHDPKNGQEACFKASWLINVLHDGIGVPRIGLEDLPQANLSKGAQGALEQAKGKGFLEPFQPVDKINDIEVSWTLGKMVLYAAGQIPPESGDDRFPVGFGSNLVGANTATIPDDFQFAGSSWRPIGSSNGGNVTAGHGSDWENDDWDMDAEDILDRAKTRSTTGFFLFLAGLALVMWWFRKRERRMRVYSRFQSFARRRRSHGGKYNGMHSVNRSPLTKLTTKLFGGRTSSGGSYERVMEEGELDRFELGDVASSSSGSGEFFSDEDSSSDHSRGSKGSGGAAGSMFGRSSGLATPTAASGGGIGGGYGFETVGTVGGGMSALNRSGLVVRTDSRERLSLPLSGGVGGVTGRRSRAGSPTRMKSPLGGGISPMDER